MSPLWVFVVFAVVSSAALLLLSVRRAHDEITPTIEAFDRFRAAISPEVATLKVETVATRRRIASANAELDHRATPSA
ncbi:MAG: hypothetical protein ACXW1S_06765 [Acidimicrobiia bacterium]